MGKKPQKKQLESEFLINFIERKIEFFGESTENKFQLSANSSYSEIPSEKVWDNVWLKDLKQLGQLFMQHLQNHPINSNSYLYNKKIVSLDIETTDFIPKAREGFVNTIALSILDCHESKLINDEGNYQKPEFIMHQSFNMLRKKEDVPNLLHLAWSFIYDADILLVFNAGFDITILTTVIQNYQLKYKFPPLIIDLMKYARSLDVLEQKLEKLIHFRRSQTQKGEYSAYYKIFKGQGSKGINKQLEPLGVYNLMDTLTPLFYYIINYKSINQ